MSAGLYSGLGCCHCARPFCSHTPLTRIPSACQTCRDIRNKLVFSKSVDACWGQPEFVSCLEHVQVRLTLSHNQRGKLAIHLISPLGTHSTLLFPRYVENSTIKMAICMCVPPLAHCTCVCLFMELYLCMQPQKNWLKWKQHVVLFFQAQWLLLGGLQQLDFYDHALMGWGASGRVDPGNWEHSS